MIRWQRHRRQRTDATFRRRLRSLEGLESRCLLAGDVLISEFMAANASTLVDEDGDTSDWFELHNPTPNAVDLTGWTVSDNAGDLDKWVLPAAELVPGGFLVIFASGKNRRTSESELHTNFKLSKDGEYLGLGRPDGTVEDEFRDQYPAQRTDVSYGQNIVADELTRGFMIDPTPGAQNSESRSGFAGDVRIDTAGGIFSDPILVDISSMDPDATIRYTVDGSLPTESNGHEYIGPLEVSSTTTLRAASFQPDYFPSATQTSSYLFLDDFARQTRPDAYPELTSGDNYEVDPKIALSPQYHDRFLAGLQDIPTMSLVMDVDDFLGRSGIYSNSTQRGDRWERAVSVELFDPHDNSTTQIDAGLRVQGGASRAPQIGKHSLSLRFRDQYGADHWEHPVFENSPVDRFSTLALRAGSNNSWVSGNAVDRRHAQSIRDQWIRDSLLEMGHVDAGQGKFVHVYVNGLYWGVYNLTERPDAEHYAAYFGGDADLYDAFNGSEVIDGTADARAKVKEIAASGDWEALQQLVDIDLYIDYNIINRYGANGDLDVTRNYRLAGGGPNNVPFRLYPWDSEEVLINAGSIGTPTDPLGLRIHVEKLEEYRLRFADRLQKHFFGDGAMTPEHAAARWRQRADEIDLAIIGESARWGDHQRPGRPYDRDGDWLTEQNRLLKDYFPRRSDVVIRVYRDEGLFPNIDAPTFNQQGGIVPHSFEVGLSAESGTIYYTTDGTDPRLPGGAISDSAMIFRDPLRLTEDTMVKSRAVLDGEWSALNAASFVVASQMSLRISEINAAPHEPNLVPGINELNVSSESFEFIELKNVGDHPINLQGVQLIETIVDFEREGIEFAFAQQELGPGEHIVVARNRQAFQSRYGSQVRIASGTDGVTGTRPEFGGALADDGEQVTLLDSQGQIIQQFSYSFDRSTHSRSSGRGSSLEPIDLLGDYSDTSNWRESSEFGGSPGIEGRGPDGRILVNEVLTTDGEIEGWLELYNASGQDIDISDWYLGSTFANVFESRLQPGSVIDAGGYESFTLSQLSLNINRAHGGDIFLVEADEVGFPISFVDIVAYPTTMAGVPAGRASANAGMDLVLLERATPGHMNASPLVGDMVISEVHFHATDLDGESVGQRPEVFEFIELLNRSERDIDLTGWKVSGDVDYLFRNGPVVAAGETVLVVSFLPNRSTQANPFRDAFGIDKSVRLAGPYLGSLSNQTGAVRLEMPLEAPADETYFTPFVTLDGVNFASRMPWPESASGHGDSLTRKSAQHGYLAGNWAGESPTPGKTDLAVRWMGDANGDGRFDSSDLVYAMLSGKFETHVAATFAEGDWNGDGVFDADDFSTAFATGRYEA